MLVRQTFRHSNGRLATNILVEVTVQDQSQVVASETTDEFGTVVIDLDPGLYDWVALGARTPFEVAVNSNDADQVHAELWEAMNNLTDSVATPEDMNSLHDIEAGLENILLWYENGKA